MIHLISSSYFPSTLDKVVVMRQRRQPPSGQHQHDDFYEIALICAGTCIHVQGKFKEPLRRGDVVLIAGNRKHSYKNTEGLYLVNILIRHEFLISLGKSFKTIPGFTSLFGGVSKSQSISARLSLPSDEFDKIEAMALEIEQETSKGLPGRKIAESYLSIILSILCRKGSGKRGDSTASRSQITEVLDLMEKNYQNKLPISKLAQRFGMSHRSFLRHFQRVMGITPARYLLQLRLHIAREKLQFGDSTRSISEIAGDCGFDDSNYFCRAFRKAFGDSPRSYRSKSRDT